MRTNSQAMRSLAVIYISLTCELRRRWIGNTVLPVVLGPQELLHMPVMNQPADLNEVRGPVLHWSHYRLFRGVSVEISLYIIGVQIRIGIIKIYKLIKTCGGAARK